MTGEPPPIAPALADPITPSAAPADPKPFTPQPIHISARRRGRGALWAALIAFVLGITAMFFAWPTIERWRGVKPGGEAAAPIAVNPAAAPGAGAAATAPITIEGLAAREAALDLQLRSIEVRLAYADAASRASAADASRAERLMLAFAARRRIDRGLPLGEYEPLLRNAFSSEAATQTATVIAAAKAPLTVSDLRQALDNIAPKLMGGSVRDGIGSAIWREVSGLIVLRRDSTPSPRGIDRLDRARRLLDAAQVEAALAEVARMPGVAEAKSWTDAANRYIATRNALNALEMVALSHPATPAPPGQPSPTAQASPILPGATPATQ